MNNSVKQLVVISGKGGTGKTSITAALADCLKPVVLADCDVDATDLHLIASPVDDTGETDGFKSGSIAEIEDDLCNLCLTCTTLCRFSAIRSNKDEKSRIRLYIDPFSCEGCGVCVDNCPQGAIKEVERTAGEIVKSNTRFGTMIRGVLFPGQPNSGKLVTQVRHRALSEARKSGCPYVLIDGPPGIGCPVIATLTGADVALIVTEPTVAAIHDMERVLELCRHFRITPLIVINKCDLNSEKSAEIEMLCLRLNIGVAGKLPYDEAFTAAMVEGKTVIEYSLDSGVAIELRKIGTNLITAAAPVSPV